VEICEDSWLKEVFAFRYSGFDIGLKKSVLICEIRVKQKSFQCSAISRQLTGSASRAGLIDLSILRGDRVGLDGDFDKGTYF